MKVSNTRHWMHWAGAEAGLLPPRDRPRSGNANSLPATVNCARWVRSKDFQRMDEHCGREQCEEAGDIAHAERSVHERYAQHELRQVRPAAEYCLISRVW